MTRSALLWLTHVWAPELQAEFERLYDMEGPGLPEVWLLLDSRTTGAADLARRYRRSHVFDERTLFSLPYPKLDGYGLMYHHHFPILDFFLTRPAYDQYWVVEYDVRYTGRWESLIRAFQPFPHDFITSHIRRFAQEPRWVWWHTLHHPSKIMSRDRYLRSFNVIYRISNRALRFLHDAQIDGWRGYSEVSFPTLLHDRGFSLLDFGGSGEFTPAGFRNKSYTSSGLGSGLLTIMGTLRFRPARASAGWRKNKLYHPVKPRSMIEPLTVRLRMAAEWAREVTRDLVRRSRARIGSQQKSVI